MAQRIIFLFLALPTVMRMGVLILTAAGTSDLLYHAAPLAWAIDLDRYLGVHGAGAHVVTLLGMVVTLLGLLIRRASVQIAHVPDATSERTPIGHEASSAQDWISKR